MLAGGVERAIAQTTYRVQHNSGTSVATGITTNSQACGDQPETTIVTLLSTSAFDCATDRIEAPAGQVIFDAYVSTAYAQDTVVTGGSFSMRIRSNGATSTVSAQLFSVNASGTRTFIGTAVNSPNIDDEATYSLNLSSQSATVPSGSKLGLRLRSNGPEFRWFWGSTYGAFGGTLVVTETSASATTTLGNGTDPSGAQLAPGGAATFADAFTVHTSSGTDTLTAITVSTAAGSSGGLGLVEITSDTGAVVYGSASNPSSDTIAVALTSSITATTTSTQYKVRVTPKSHAAMPAPMGSTYAVTARVSGWTGTNSQAGSDTAGTTVTIDNLSPGNVSGSTATSASTHVSLAWSLPTDVDLAGVIVLRRAGAAVSDAPSEGASYAAGAALGSSVVACVVTTPPASCTDVGLLNGTTYHYKVFALDSSGNYATGVVPAGSPVTPTAGVTLTPTSGLVTSESGTSATFLVVLTSQPTADVTVTLTSSDATEGTATPASVTFTAATWHTPQTVTVVGVDDASADGNRPYVIQTAAAASADQGYSGLDPADVSVTNTDDDIVGVTVTPTSGLITSEAGNTATFTIVLNSMPVADVTIALSSSDASEGTVAPAAATFAPGSWNVPQTITVSGVDDAVQDGEQTFTVSAAETTSADPLYDGLDPADVSVRNADDDTAGVTVTPTGGLVTTENGGSATFTVTLTSQPTADVTVALSSSDTTEGTVAPASLLFTPLNWSVAQTVTVTGVADAVDDGDVVYSIATGSAISADPAYDGADAGDVSVTNVDIDAAGVVITPSTGLVTTEAGGATAFTVVLTSQPTADVRIDLSTTDSTEGSTAPSSLTFNSTTWSAPQTVTITGVDDPVADGDVIYSIVTAPAVSVDPDYAGMDAADVSVTNADDDQAGVTITPTSGLITNEAGGTATFSVVLNTAPTADVVITLSSTHLEEGRVHPESLTFSPAAWNAPQTVTIIGVDDHVADGSRAYSIITGPAASTDANFTGIDPPDVGVVNVDDDRAGITVTPTTGLVTSEAGQGANFTIVLNTQPVADVMMEVSSALSSEATVSPGAVRFTPADWSVPQTVTITGVNDGVADGSAAYVVSIAPATSLDAAYHGLDASDVSGVNLDDDSPGVTVTPASGLLTSERGGSASFVVVLQTRPSADVTLSLTSSRPEEGTVTPARVRLTPLDWNVPTTVTVTGVDDGVHDGPQPYRVITGPAVSADASYSGLDAADVRVTNLDDDLAGLDVVASPALTTSEGGGTTTFSVVLRTQPRTVVDVPIASSNTSEGIVSSPLLTFTPDDWDVPATVTVTGVDDRVRDGAAAYRVAIGPATAGDSAYHGARAADLTVINVELESLADSAPGPGARTDLPEPDSEGPVPGPAPTSTQADDGSTAGTSTVSPGRAAAAADQELSGIAPTVDSPVRQPVPPLIVAPPSQRDDTRTPPSEVASAEPEWNGPPTGPIDHEEKASGTLPIVHHIGPRRVPEDTPLELSRARGTALVVTDPDGLDHYIVVSLVARRGRMTLARTKDLWFSEGAAVDAIAMTFKGRVQAVNGALDGLRFEPDPDYVGDAGLCIDASHPPRRADLPSLCVDRVEALWPDATLGPRMAVWVPILVTPLNDAPTLAATPDARVAEVPRVSAAP